MPRRGNIAKRDVLPDPLYNSKLVTRLINNVMYDGKKVLLRRLFTVHSILLLKKPVKILWNLLPMQWKTSCLY